jgi:ubiquinone/menaquinone biosynthesis C-methylase UbiE
MTLPEADNIIKGLWDRDVRAWDVHWVPIFRRFAHDLVRDAGISDGHIVLDIGTGTGIAALEAVRHRVFVFGIDRSRAMLTAAMSNASRMAAQNLRFLLMDANHLYLPGSFFDAVISNCGIPFSVFDETVVEVFRVLRRGGSFVYNDWRLKDVTAFRIFGEVLQRHRTHNPSNTLRNRRGALAIYERYANREMSVRTQLQELRRVGFSHVRLKHRIYHIRLAGVYDFLEMRFSRATLRQELKELPKQKRRALYSELADALKPFTRKKSFILDWNVSFIQAKKT